MQRRKERRKRRRGAAAEGGSPGLAPPLHSAFGSRQRVLSDGGFADRLIRRTNTQGNRRDGGGAFTHMFWLQQQDLLPQGVVSNGCVLLFAKLVGIPKLGIPTCIPVCMSEAGCACLHAMSRRLLARDTCPLYFGETCRVLFVGAGRASSRPSSTLTRRWSPPRPRALRPRCPCEARRGFDVGVPGFGPRSSSSFSPASRGAPWNFKITEPRANSIQFSIFDFSIDSL